MKRVKDLKSYYFECDCHSQEHTIGVAFDIENKEMMLFTQLARNKGFFKRLVLGIKYILGMESKYGQWDETLMQEEKFLELYNVMTRFTYTAGIRDKSAKKIKTALVDISKGEKNSVISSGTHHAANRNVLDKYKKEK